MTERGGVGPGRLKAPEYRPPGVGTGGIRVGERESGPANYGLRAVVAVGLGGKMVIPAVECRGYGGGPDVQAQVTPG